jgi:hypothetical protein
MSSNSCRNVSLNFFNIYIKKIIIIIEKIKMQFYCADCHHFYNPYVNNTIVYKKPAQYYVHWNYFMDGSSTYSEKIKFYCRGHFEAYNRLGIDDFCLSYGFIKDLTDKRTSI